MQLYVTMSTYDMFTGSIEVGVHTKVPFLKVAPAGGTVVRVTVMTSPSSSVAVTSCLFSTFTVTRNTSSTVMLGLAFAENNRMSVRRGHANDRSHLDRSHTNTAYYSINSNVCLEIESSDGRGILRDLDL